MLVSITAYTIAFFLNRLTSFISALISSRDISMLFSLAVLHMFSKASIASSVTLSLCFPLL